MFMASCGPNFRGLVEGPLETRLVQKRVYHCCSAENGPLSASGQLPTPNWMTTVSIVPHCGGDDESTASAPALSDSHASTHLHQLHWLYRPTTHDELPGDDWGGDTSQWPGMREREVVLTCATPTKQQCVLLGDLKKSSEAMTCLSAVSSKLQVQY